MRTRNTHELHNRFKTSENSANFGNSVSGTNLNPRSPSSSIAPNRSASSSFTPSGDATKPSSGNADSSQDRSSVQPKPYSGSRMISYVETYGPLVSPNSNTDNKSKRAQQIGQRAEEIVKDYLAGTGFSVIHRGGTNPGYDIEAIDEETNEIFFVEVKGVALNWNLRGVALSKTQMQKCLKYGDNFWLFIVEYVFGQPILHKLVNPHSKIDFYCFDSNWKLHQHPNDEFGITFNPKVPSSLKLPDIDISESFFSSPQHQELYNKLQELCKGRHDVIDLVLGYPLQNEQGAIILELEMAWPFVKKGVLIDEQHLSVEGWDLKTVEQVLDDLAWLPL